MLEKSRLYFVVLQFIKFRVKKSNVKVYAILVADSSISISVIKTIYWIHFQSSTIYIERLHNEKYPYLSLQDKNVGGRSLFCYSAQFRLSTSMTD